MVPWLGKLPKFSQLAIVKITLIEKDMVEKCGLDNNGSKLS